MKVHAAFVYNAQSDVELLRTVQRNGMVFAGGDLQQLVNSRTQGLLYKRTYGSDCVMPPESGLVVVGGRNSIRQAFAALGDKHFRTDEPGHRLYLSSIHTNSRADLAVGTMFAAVGRMAAAGLSQSGLRSIPDEAEHNAATAAVQTKKLTLVRLFSAPRCPVGVPLDNRASAGGIAVQLAVMWRI